MEGALVALGGRGVLLLGVVGGADRAGVLVFLGGMGRGSGIRAVALAGRGGGGVHRSAVLVRVKKGVALSQRLTTLI